MRQEFGCNPELGKKMKLKKEYVVDKRYMTSFKGDEWRPLDDGHIIVKEEAFYRVLRTYQMID